MFKVTLITIGNKMPAWVEEAVSEFVKRLKDQLKLKIIEIPLTRRGKSNDLDRILDKETTLIRAQIPEGAYCVALAIDGITYSSTALATKLDTLQQEHSHLCFLIGGPEGLSSALLEEADARWSLSALTLPHTLVRIVLLEALYRAYSILNNHPYHK